MLAGFRLFVLVFVLAGAAAQAQATPSVLPERSPLQEPRFMTIGAGSIPRDVVATLAQDRAGLIWIATGDGLVRFDGYRFRPQERESSNPARRNLGWIRAMLPARDGRLWIGTENNGLVGYDPVTEQVSDFGLGENAGEGADRGVLPTVRALAEGADGRIWVGSIGGGVDRFDPATSSFTRFRNSGQPGSLPDDRVQALLVDRRGTLWVGTWHGLSRLTAGSSHFEPVAPALAGEQVQALHEATDGRIWVGTQQGTVAIVDPATGDATPLGNSGASRRAGVTSFVEAAGGETWVGTLAGIDIFDSALRLLLQLRHDISKPTGLAGNEVTTLVRDHAGWIWVGGFGLGLQRHNPNNRSIWIRGADATPGSRLDGPSVRSLLQLDNGEIWAASHRGGIAVMDNDLRVIGEVVPQANGSAARIAAMAQTRDGSVWLGAETTIYQYSRNRQLMRVMQTGLAACRTMLAGSDGSLWIATEDGLYRLEPGAAAPQRVATRAGTPPLNGAVHAVIEAADGGIWVGTAQGLFHLPAGNNELIAVSSPPGAGLGYPSIAGMLVDQQHTLWVDTGIAGLHRMTTWDGQQASFDRVSERHGIVNRPFGANLLADQRGRIWTQRHLYDPVSDRLSDLTAVDGADLGTGWFGSYVQTADGRMLFGGSKGVMVVRPESFDVSDYAPPLLITELRINGNRQPAGQLARGLQVTPQQRSFSIEFAALDYSDPARIRYAYRLEGFDPDWINTGPGNRIASYGNLDPGSYLLRIRATNRSGVWNDTELAIDVEVLPAWWQQWWFRLLAGLLLLALLAAVVHWRTRRLKANQLALESKVEKRTAELRLLTMALQEASLTDPLTGLRNRRFLELNIAADAAQAVRAREGRRQPPRSADGEADVDLIFYMFDIDHFKAVNDRHGHAAGDAVIMQTSNRLKAVFRESDHLVRWGGEEFLVVARNTTRANAAELAERARAAIADEPFVLDDGIRLSKTCSVGFACFPLSEQQPLALDWETVIDIADACLYAVKRAGRNGWLGALRIRAGSAATAPKQARGPLVDWVRSGDLQTVAAQSLGDWTSAAQP
ncbi:two-component regulator propeller domain-containing protein [Piscinibacter sakaiensis]|uniref:two-component regulator propeller domain-containing protein n=1 Tax=Piscinibacter sakaiensis TaxID=1547922 RepID=UPI003AACFC51